MSFPLSLRSQRLRSRKAEFTHQLIVFRLRQEWFALPIQAVQKVIPLGTEYGVSAGRGIGLTLYRDREVPVLDMQQRIFSTVSGTGSQPLLPQPASDVQASVPQPGTSAPLPQPQRFLLLVETVTGEVIGLPLDTQPMLRRVPESAFAPLSATYLTGGQLRCVKCLIIQASDQPPMFLLDLDQLLQAQPTLPESRRTSLPD